ncbi:MAG: 5-deoxy-glucuronate isomerase [Caulobacteraceae bacterium]
MSRLLVKGAPPDAQGRMVAVTPASAGWSRVGFSAWRLAPGQKLTWAEAGREALAVVLAGKVEAIAGDLSPRTIGERASVFDDLAPAALYAPAGARLTITARTTAEIALCTAPGGVAGSPRFLDPAGMSLDIRGVGSNRRLVRNILPESESAESLLVVEVVTPAGHWSSWPPHKHDSAEAGRETALEETYYHRLRPAQGFAFQRVYTDDGAIDEALTVHDGDVVLVPRGYHPVGAPHGYDLYYLNVMAGPERRWLFRNDPAHAWMVEKR